jgi:hypothetical protein
MMGFPYMSEDFGKGLILLKPNQGSANIKNYGVVATFLAHEISVFLIIWKVNNFFRSAHFIG